MATQPHLAPDPFDKEVEAMLQDPRVIARLDDLHARLDRGELETLPMEEVRSRIERLIQERGGEGGTPLG